MKILTRLRGIRYQIVKLQENQKEVEPPVTACTGSTPIGRDPLFEIDTAIREVEALYQQLIEVQGDHIKLLKQDFDENNY